MILSKSIDSIRDQLDKPPNEITLGMGELKNLLSEWFLLALNMEAGAGISDLAIENENLKKLAEQNKAQIDVLRANLHSILAKEDQTQKATSEEPDPNTGKLLLEKLDTFSGRRLTIEEIADACGISKTEVAVELRKLKAGNWVEHSSEFPNGVWVEKWHRSLKGDEYILKIWAEDPAALPKSHERILVAISKGVDRSENERKIHSALLGFGEKIDLNTTIEILNELQASEYVRRFVLPLAVKEGFDWHLLPRGEEYLRRRRMLDQPIGEIKTGRTIPKKTEDETRPLSNLEEGVLFFLSTNPDEGVPEKYIFQQIARRIRGVVLLDVEEALEALEAVGFAVPLRDVPTYGSGTMWLIQRPGQRYLRDKQRQNQD